jgi:hypothetical protein
MMLDERIFQPQGLVFALHNNNFDRPDAADEGSCFDILRAGKIGFKAGPQRLGFTHIQSLARITLHDIDTRVQGRVPHYFSESLSVFFITWLVHINSNCSDNKKSIMQKICLMLIVYLFLGTSGSLFCIGERTISLGGASSWNFVETRSGIAEAGLIRSRPVLVLSAASGGRRGANPAGTAAGALDLSLSFDEGNPGLFKDSAARYRIVVSPLLEAVDRSYARAGTGAALFSTANNSGTLAKPGSLSAPLVIEPHSRAALFAPDSRIGDFTLEFWLYPLNMENGEQILSWLSSHPYQGKDRGKDYAFQRIMCTAVKNRLSWSFADFFASPDASKYLNVTISGSAPVVPKTWSHHLLRFDSATGMVEYLVNGKTQAIEYASSTGHEGGEVYTPIAGLGGIFALGGNFMGLMDEFKIHGAWIDNPSTQKYKRQGGRIETRAIDLGGDSGSVIKVDASGGRTSITGMRVSGEFQENGRFRFADDTGMQFFIRAAGNPYQWDNTPWHVFTPGQNIDGSIRGRYVQIAVDFYPSADGESSPYLEELRITYMPEEPPLPPANLTAIALDGAVQLRWKNSPDVNTAGYLVYYGAASDEYFGEEAALGASPIDAGKQNSIFIEGLKNGTLYYFRIAAYDRMNPGSVPSFHAGEFSREVRARPLQGLSALSMTAGMAE